MNLIDEMNKSLPMYAYPTQYFLGNVDKCFNLNSNSRLAITSVYEASNNNGIMCGIEFDDKMMFTSINFLDFRDRHILNKEIDNYKIEFNKSRKSR